MNLSEKSLAFLKQKVAFSVDIFHVYDVLQKYQERNLRDKYAGLKKAFLNNSEVLYFPNIY